MLFIITEYYHPFTDAGGPLRSIDQLILALKDQFQFSVISSAINYKGDKIPKDIPANQYYFDEETQLHKYYSDNTVFGHLRLAAFLFRNRQKRFYINGIFIPRLSLLPALICKKIIVSPRGMLIEETFGKKAFLKKMYLKLLKLFLSRSTIWHATDEREVADIKKFFGKHCKIFKISNMPVQPLPTPKKYHKKEKSLYLVYVGLIVEKKGLYNLLKALAQSTLSISLDIYGPVKDESYWLECIHLIKSMPSHVVVNYRGHIDPDKVQLTLQQYDAFVLLTKGENFGHAIFESLSVGTPVIITKHTPWVFEENITPAGWIIPDKQNKIDYINFLKVCDLLYHMDADHYASVSTHAHQHAKAYINSVDLKNAYADLFHSI